MTKPYSFSTGAFLRGIRLLRSVCPHSRTIACGLLWFQCLFFYSIRMAHYRWGFALSPAGPDDASFWCCCRYNLRGIPVREWPGIFYAEGHNILLIEAGDMFREAPDTSNLFGNVDFSFCHPCRPVGRFFLRSGIKISHLIIAREINLFVCCRACVTCAWKVHKK